MRANFYLFVILLLSFVLIESKSHNKKSTKGKQVHLSVQQIQIPENENLLELETQEDREQTQLLETKSTNQLSNTTSIEDVDLNSIDYESLPSDQRLGENDDEDTLVAYVLLALLWLVILHAIRWWLEQKMDSYLIPTNHAIYRDVTILSFIFCLSVILHYEEVFEDAGVNWREFHLGFALFIIIWLALGVGFLITAQSIGRRWQQQEEDCGDLRLLSNDYDRDYREAQNAEQLTWSKRRKVIETQNTFTYAVLRHSFINHKFLPTVQECYLRDDFNFGLYLCKCLGLLINHLFKLAFTSYVLIGICLGLWWALRQLDDEDQALIILFVPALIMLIAIGIRYQLQKILMQIVEFPGDISNYKLFDDEISPQRDPDLYSEEIPVPQYLRQSNEQKVSKSWKGAIFGSVPNRHENLFPFDGLGVVLMTFFMQTIVIIGSLWFVAMCTIHIDDIYGKCGDVGATILIILIFISWLVTLGYYIPEILRLLNLTSCTGMLKRNVIIDEVSQEQRNQRSKLSFKFYRKIKQYRKNNAQEDKLKQTTPHIQKLVEEAYTLLGAKENQLPVSKIPELGKLCGIELDIHQIKIIQQSCSVSFNIQNEKQTVHIKEFINYIEQFQYDISQGPRKTVNSALQQFAQQKYGQPCDFILPGDLRAFIDSLDEKGDFFTDEEKDVYTKQLLYLKNKDSNLYLNDIANLVANDLEHMRW